MKKTKVVAVAAAAVMAAAAVGSLAGCTDKAHTISVFLLTNTTETKVYKQYFKDLEAELKAEGLDYKIDFDGKEEKDYYTKLKSDNARGKLPDVFYLRPNELLQYKDVITNLQEFADEQEYANLDDIYELALDMYRFNPATGELGNPDDDLYAFPKDLSTQQLGYNRTLLEEYKVAIEKEGYKMPWDMNGKPYTWEQYKQINKIIADAIGDSDKRYACDVPSIEILAKSFGADSLIDLSGGRANGVVTSLSEGALNKAIKYQAELVDIGANYKAATYQNFTSGKVCFYGLTASWEIAEYNNLIGEGNWEVMPWPVEKEGDSWNGLITSAGYVVSKECASQEKGAVAMRVAISFLSNMSQERLVKEDKITLPLRKSVASDYRSSASDTDYSPKSRSIFLDVISGDHGFLPAEYSTYNSEWLSPLSKALETLWLKGKGNAVSYFTACNTNGTWNTVRSEMQDKYDDVKTK